MRFSHDSSALSASFDEPNLVSCAGLAPVLALAERAGLAELVGQHLTLAGEGGANAAVKVTSLVAGMLAGADCIDDMDLLRHGAMARLFTGVRAPSTLGICLRAFTFGQVRQLDAVAARLLPVLVGQAPILPDAAQVCYVDLDDTVKATHGYQKQGAGYGYSGVKGLNALIATISTPTSRPLIVAIRLRRGGTNSARGAARIVATPGHDAGLRRFGAGDRARRQRLLRPGRHRRGPPRRGEVLHHRPDEPRCPPGHRQHPGVGLGGDPLPERDLG